MDNLTREHIGDDEASDAAIMKAHEMDPDYSECRVCKEYRHNDTMVVEDCCDECAEQIVCVVCNEYNWDVLNDVVKVCPECQKHAIATIKYLQREVRRKMEAAEKVGKSCQTQSGVVELPQTYNAVRNQLRFLQNLNNWLEQQRICIEHDQIA